MSFPGMLQQCGLYYWDLTFRKYLPQVSIRAHATIISSVARTTLTQTFVNPNGHAAIPELVYEFPLYDGATVVAFSCNTGDRIIRGVVKEKGQALATYQEAVSRGETAGLLQRSAAAADVFSTSIGNVPAGATVVVDITYIGELKHDAEHDAIRFTIPTVIAPRYGRESGTVMLGNGSQQRASAQGIQIVVDAEMPANCSIKSIQSPSHPISVSIGSTSTSSPEVQPSLCRASASLSLGTAELDRDFVLHVVAANSEKPVAVLEQHPSLPDQRALMVTLVPRFNLPSERPEVVFVCDRSGSMNDGYRIQKLVSALHIFLKSLPVGVKFNICSFGSSYQFLWPRSKTYDQVSLTEATCHVKTFAANFGGTEMYQPLEAAIKQRYSDLNLEIFLLTDGEIWDQNNVFQLVNKAVADSNGAVRVFTIGLGNNVSHSLVEGIARAGNAFSQIVADDEGMDKKIVRMLKASLFPHISDYALEVKYAPNDAGGLAVDDEDDDFELVDKVIDCLNISVVENGTHSSATATATSTATPLEPISLFDTSAKVETVEHGLSADAGAKFAHLPAVSVPKILQAPYQIPNLFPFSRVNVFLLMSGAAAVSQRRPVSVVLRGTCIHGPLELDIPISDLGQGETIHQLAARNAIGDLEEGRGWLVHAKLPPATVNGVPGVAGPFLKDRYEGQFSDMVEREAVRLGIQYQVAGKWCSFVAVDPKPPLAEPANREGLGSPAYTLFSHVCQSGDVSGPSHQGGVFGRGGISGRGGRFGRGGGFGGALGSGGWQCPEPQSFHQNQQQSQSSPRQQQQQPQYQQQQQQQYQQHQMQGQMQMQMQSGMPGRLQACMQPMQPMPQMRMQSMQQMQMQPMQQMQMQPMQQMAQQQAHQHGAIMSFNGAEGPTGLFSNAQRTLDLGLDTVPPLSATRKKPKKRHADMATEDAAPNASGGLFGTSANDDIAARAPNMLPEWAKTVGTYPTMSAKAPSYTERADVFSRLVGLQTFEGSWQLDALLATLGILEGQVFATVASVYPGLVSAGIGNVTVRNLIATACALAYLRTRLASERDVWELMADKATAWAQSQIRELGFTIELENLVTLLEHAL